MTFLSYTVTLNDNDLQTLEEALSHYLELCENEILHGAGAPFFAHRESIKDIRSKLLAAMIRDLGSHQRLGRRAEKSSTLPHGPARKGRAKRVHPRTRMANKHRRSKRKPK